MRIAVPPRTEPGFANAAPGRAAFLRSLLVLPLATLPATVLQPALAVIGEAVSPKGTTRWQSDDKSFNFLLPQSWTLAPESGRTGEGSFRLAARRNDGAATLELTVDIPSCNSCARSAQ